MNDIKEHLDNIRVYPEYKSKTNGSIAQLNTLSVSDLEKELMNMSKDTLIKICIKAIWASGLLSDHIEDNK